MNTANSTVFNEV